MPLAIGNEWVYQVTTVDERALSASVWFDTVRVVNDTVLNEETWYIMGESTIDLHDDILLLEINRDDGYWLAQLPVDGQSSFNLNESARLIAKYPTVAGDSFRQGGSPPGDDLIHVDASDFPVAVPAGTFKTYCYRNESGYLRSYLSVNVGTIKTEAWRSATDDMPATLVSTRELLSFDLR